MCGILCIVFNFHARQLLLDDMKLLGWLKCADCAHAAKKARGK
jgi:hypothetical protein